MKNRRAETWKYLLGVLCAIHLGSGICQAAEYDATLDFNSADQSMWTTGDAWQFNWRQDYTLYNWNYTFETPKAGIKFPDLVFGGNLYIPSTDMYSLSGHTDGKVGFSPYVSIDSGSVDVSYSSAVTFQYPDAHTIKPGESFTISTSAASLGTGTFTTNFPEVKAGVDLLFETHASLGLNTYAKYPTDWFLGVPVHGEWNTAPTQTKIVSLDIAPDTGLGANVFGVPIGPYAADLIYEDGRIPGVQFHNDQISVLGQTVADLGDGVDLLGYGSVALNVPDIDTTGHEATGFTATGADDLFRLSIDADKIATDIIDKAIAAAIAAGTAGTGSGAAAINLPDLEGSTNLAPILGATLASLIPVDLSYNILDLEPFLDVDLSQTFSFTPDDLMVSFDLGNGTFTDAVKVGQDITLTMTDDVLGLTPIFSLPDSMFSNLTQLMIDLGLDVTLLDFGLNFSGILGLIPAIDPPALVHEDLTVSEILNTFNLPTSWMNPAIYDKVFGFHMPSITGSPFQIDPLIILPPGPEPVPEPGTMLLLGSGLVALAGLRRAKQRG